MQLVLTVIISTLLLLLFTGGVVLLLVLNHNRRNRYRAEMAEVRVLHAGELRELEQEVLRETLSEVGRELHDGVGQLLSASRMGATMLTKFPDAAPHASELKATLDLTIAEVRRLGRTLSTERWQDTDLEAVLRQECDRIKRLGALPIELAVEGTPTELTADQKLVLFRLFQESVNNAMKHAAASRIVVELDWSRGPTMRIQDDGRGFEPGRLDAVGAGQGLRNLRDRAQLIGYTCDITSQPGKGTTVLIHP